MKTAKSNLCPVQKEMCATCPFRPGSPYANLARDLGQYAITQHSRVCHSTGSSAINPRTGKPEKLCRGARNFQLNVFFNMGFIDAPTDEAWAAKCVELGIWK